VIFYHENWQNLVKKRSSYYSVVFSRQEIDENVTDNTAFKSKLNNNKKLKICEISNYIGFSSALLRKC